MGLYLIWGTSDLFADGRVCVPMAMIVPTALAALARQASRRVAKVARRYRRGRSTLVSKIGTSGATKRVCHWVQTLVGTGFCGPSAALIRLERTSQGLPRERSECFGYSLRESSCGVNRKVNCAAREATLGCKSLCVGHHGIDQRFLK